jgi:Leucine-rich repeat (LRR) protein
MKSIFYLALAIMITLTSSVPVLAVDTFSCGEVTEIPQIECEALVALYTSTNGPGWTNKTEWLLTNTPSTWYGVTVLSSHVTSLILQSNNLNGSLPFELGNLTSLTVLFLDHNNLFQGIPYGLGNLTSLTALDLSSNWFYSSIPSVLGGLTNLTYLNLNASWVGGSIPTQLGNLINLNYLDLGWNQLAGAVPAELGNLAALDELYIQGNAELSGPLPSSLTSLSLEAFWFGDSGLCEPDDLSFQAWMNTIPDVRRTGVLCGSGFTCDFVTEIPPLECEALVALYNNTNGASWTHNSHWLLNTTPSNWSGITVESGHVTRIDFYQNNASGTLPIEIANLTSLTFLDFYQNQLTGNIPVEMGNLINLTSMIFYGNKLSGSIPPSLGNLVNLETLTFGVNQLSGSIPSELSTLNKLTGLELIGNQLSGGIPPELGLLTSLGYMDMRYNQLSGNIPSELGNLNNLTHLLLSYNQLNGPIPPELGDLTNLTNLALGSNHLNGSIPPELGNLIHLPELNLANNELSGSIPPELSHITNLQFMYLSQNQLSGSIPAELGSLPILHGLYLSSNQLSGSIPTELSTLPLNVLYLDDNRLSGDIPSELANLGNLYALDLDYNMLNVPPGYPIQGNPWHDFLSQKDPDWQLYQGFEQVIGSLGGELISLDGKTDILIPAGAVDGEITFTYIPIPGPHHSSGWMAFANNSFDLSAEDSLGNPVTTFNLPLTVTLTYTDTDVIGIPENILGLYYWDENAVSWSDAATTCPDGEYTRDLEGNQLILPLCHLTEFGLFGNPLHIFLPVIRR